MTRQVERMYRVKAVGEISQVSEHYYVISPERKLKHPAVIAISEAARTSLLTCVKVSMAVYGGQH